MAVAITNTGGDIAGVAASGNVASYAGAAIGTATSDRIVVVCVGTELTSSVPTACTIDGTAMTAGVAATQGAVNSHIFYLRWPTGTTATINVTFGATNPTGAQNKIAVFGVTGAGLPISAASSVADTDADPISSGALTVPTSGGGIAICANATDTTLRTWTGFAEDLDVDAGDFHFSTGTTTTAGTPTITVSGGNNEDGALSWVIFGLNNTLTASLFTDGDRFITDSLLRFNGADGSTTFTDDGGFSWTANGNVQLDTAQSKFGGSSALFDGTTDYLTGNAASQFEFGTGDFTIDCWVRFNAIASFPIIWDFRSSAGSFPSPALYVDTSASNVVKYYVGVDAITGTTTLTTGQWYHLAVARSGTSTKLFLDGVQEGSTYSDVNNYIVGASRPTIGAIGSGSVGDNAVNGWIDEFRVCRRAVWTTNFTPPTESYGAVEPKITLFLTPALYTDDDTFFTPTIEQAGAQDLQPALFEDGDTFNTHTLTNLNTLAPDLYVDADTFFGPTVTNLNTIAPDLYSDADTFYQFNLTLFLTPNLYTDADTFFAVTVTATYTLAPDLFVDADTFNQHTLTNLNTIAPNLYADADTFFEHVLTQEGGTQTLVPDLFVDGDTFHQFTVTLFLTPSLYSDADTFFNPTVTATYTLAPDLFVDADTFNQHTLTNLNTVAPNLYTDDDTFFTHVLTQEGGPQTLAPDLFADGDTFYQFNVTLFLTPDLFTDADTFFNVTVTATYTLAPDLFVDADTFNQHTLTNLNTIAPDLYSDADTFFTHTLTQEGGTQTLTPDLFVDPDTFYAHTITGGAAEAAPSDTVGSRFVAHRFSRKRWRELREALEAQAEAAHRAEREKNDRAQEAIARAAQKASEALSSVQAGGADQVALASLTNALEAAASAKRLADVIRQSNIAYARAQAIIDDLDEEEEAIALLLAA